MKITRKLIYGLIILAVFTILSVLSTQIEIIRRIHISPLIISILLGTILSHLFKASFKEYLSDSIHFTTKYILRFGIILYGFRLTLQNLTEVGLEGLIFAIFIVSSTFIIGYIIGTKFLNMDKEITILTSVGSSICGAAAVLATESVIKTPAYKSAIAVSTVVVFGSIAMVLYPLLYEYNVFNLDLNTFGMYIGGTLHEVAHVVAAGNAVNIDVANSAVIEKMIRVILLAPFLIVLSFFWMKNDSEDERKNLKRKIVIPWFAVIFCVVIGFNSLGFVSESNIKIINIFDNFLLVMAMFALGLQTHISKFKEVGAKPFYLAFILFIWLIFGGVYALEFIIEITN